MELDSNHLQINVVTPYEVVFSDVAELITLPGEDGEFGILWQHLPIIANLKPGIVKISKKEGNIRYFVNGGITRVTGVEVSILANFVCDLDKTTKSEVINKIGALRQVADKSVKQYEMLLKFL